MSTRIFVRALILCSAAVVCSNAQQTQGPLNDQRIFDLVGAGVSTPEILRIVATAPKIDFDLRPVSTDALMKAGVSEEIIKAMAAREGGQGASTPPAVSIPPPARFQPVVTRKLLRDEVSNTQTDKPRVFVQGSNDAWSIEYGKNSGKGGSHPQTVEVMKTFGQSCPNVIITNNAQSAQYTVAFERESSKVWRRDNKMVVFNHTGDMVYAASTRELGNAVRGFCTAIR